MDHCALKPPRELTQTNQFAKKRRWSCCTAAHCDLQASVEIRNASRHFLPCRLNPPFASGYWPDTAGSTDGETACSAGWERIWDRAYERHRRLHQQRHERMCRAVAKGCGRGGKVMIACGDVTRNKLVSAPASLRDEDEGIAREGWMGQSPTTCRLFSPRNQTENGS
jgi:hypothetical protein